MKKLTILTITTWLLTSLLYATPDNNSTKKQDPYNNSYCHDHDEIAKWNKIIDENNKNDTVQALHSLWLGLCAKVEAKELTTNRAQKIFEDAKNSMIKAMEELEKYNKKDKKVEL